MNQYQPYTGQINHKPISRLLLSLNDMLDYLVRFAQVHETFRLAELQALADLSRVKLEVVHYNEYVCSVQDMKESFLVEDFLTASSS